MLQYMAELVTILLFWDKISLGIPGWLGTLHVHSSGWSWTLDHPVLVSWMLGLWACSNTPRTCLLLILRRFHKEYVMCGWLYTFVQLACEGDTGRIKTKATMTRSMATFPWWTEKNTKPNQFPLFPNDEKSFLRLPGPIILRRPWPVALPCDFHWKAKAKKANQPHLPF